MIKPKTYTTEEVLASAWVGFSLEFYTSRDVKTLADELSDITGNQVVVTDKERTTPTFSVDILYKEYDAKKPRYCFKTFEKNYNEASKILYNLLNYINQYCELDFSTKAQVSISFNHGKLETLETLANVDPGMLILKIDEKYIQNQFPKFKNSPFAVSVKKIIPLNNHILPNASSLIHNMRNSFEMPIGERYGMDLTEKSKGSLKFNYIGGPNYSEKINEFKDVLDYYIISTYQVLNDNNQKDSLEIELKNLLNTYRKIFSYYNSPEAFVEDFPGIKIYRDLKTSPDIIQSVWNNIRDQLFNFLYESGLQKIKFNFDTFSGMLQIRDAELDNVDMNEVQLINSTLKNCHLKDCQTWKCQIEKSKVEDSTIVSGNVLKKVHLINTRIDSTNQISQCYIHNSGEIINCDVEKSIIKNAGIASGANIDDETIIVDTRKDTTPEVKGGINVDEVRDVDWMKSLRDKNWKEKEFGEDFENQFRKNLLK